MKLFIVILLLLAASLIVFRKTIFHRYQQHKTRSQLRAWALSPLIETTAKTLDTIYHDINGAALSIEERTRLNTRDGTYLYGEVILYSFADLLKLAHAKTSDIFYDLGSGVGKAVFIAALTGECKKSIGIELLTPLHQAALTALQRFQTLSTEKNIQFINDNILHCDFSDADIIFINATAFYGILWDKIVEKLKQVKSGTRIIITTKSLHERHFKSIHRGGHLMSWGLASVTVYEKL